MKQFPGYTVVAQIDETLQSAVFRADKVGGTATVIIKALKTQHPSPAEIARFKHEYALIRSIDIDGVVKTLDVIDSADGIALVLEDFGAVSLKQAMRSGITLDRFLDLAIRLAQTLGTLHQHNIIHRDIKPLNILVNNDTDVIKITDFGIAAEITQQNKEIYNPQVIEGTLVYISPEQTGRMNCAVDYRSDLYSLGITFYEMLTGQVPFMSDDPMAVIHGHIARHAVPPGEHNSDIPLAVSDIVMKLLAKSPEERYQNSFGLMADLRQCRTQWQQSGRIEPFALAAQDFPLRFNIPLIMVGREPELALLHAAFDRVSHGATEIVLVSGMPGIGKSAVVNEIHKPIVGKHGHFISGKYDPYRKSVPYSALIQAFQELATQLLAQSEARIQRWRAQLLHALGPNGKIITDVIPDIALIIGKQPDIVDLPLAEAQNRFNYVFKNFVRIFAHQDHPLVVFLDDLQWADSASLALIQSIATDRSLSYFLLIGTYRDNEVAAHHPLMLGIEEIGKAGIQISTMRLDVLKADDVHRLIAGFLRSDAATCAPLADLVHEKTRGNPFFVIQFLKILYDDKKLSLVPNVGWTWDMPAIQAMQVTDNVVQLLAGKIASLPPEEKELIEVCACVGNRFDIETLSAVTARPMEELLSTLDTLIQGGFISYSRDLYQFYHDRIHEAAYSLLRPDEREKLHYRIGRRALEQATAEQIDAKIFYITDQLNQARQLLDGPAQRNELAGLNLQAGRKAKESTAYATAAGYLKIGMELLPDDAWSTQYDMAYAFHMERMECEYLNRQFEEAERIFAVIVGNAKTRVVRAKACIAMILLYTNMGKLNEAVQLGIETLQTFGIRLSRKAGKLSILRELVAIKIKLRKIRIEDIVNLPMLMDEETLVITKLLSNIGTPAYYTNPNLFATIALKDVNLYLRHGNTVSSAFGYSALAMIVGSRGDSPTAFRIGEMALKLIDKLDAKQYACKTNFLFGFFIQHWVRPVRDGIDYFRKAYQLGLDSGDLMYCANCVNNLIMNRIIMGDPIDDILAENRRYTDFIHSIRDTYNANRHAMATQYCLNIKGLTMSPYSLSTVEYDEAVHLDEMRQKGHLLYIFYHLLGREKIAYLYGRYDEACKDGDELDTIVRAPVGTTWGPEHAFYRCLTLLALYPAKPPGEQRRFMKIVQKYQKKMKQWAKHAPANFLHKYLLVEAEIAAASGRTLAAIDLYHQAIVSAHEHGYIQNEAIANERAAEFYLSKGYDEIARTYMTAAYHAYRWWGATTKAQALEHTHKRLIAREMNGRPADAAGTTDTSSGETASSILDLSTIMKASQAISGEMRLDRLLQTIMTISIANAGAQRGVLILDTDGKLTIEAVEEAGSKDVRVMQGTPLETYDGLCTAIVNYVYRSGQNLILGNASQEGAFINDPYVIKHRSRSIMCGPIMHQGKVSGIQYMENNLTANAFTPERLELLRVVSGQAAISIENAKLYELATTDGLTKLYVVRYFKHLLDQEISRSQRHGKVFSIVMTDIDHFKKFNDTYGHQLGDEVLRDVAKALKNSARTVDVVARYGGEEFIIILPETDRDGAVAAAEKFRKTVEAVEIMHRGETLHVTISLGIAVFPGHGDDKDALIKVADDALYQSKEAGRNRTTVGEKTQDHDA